MRRVSFRVPAGEKEELLDALMPLLAAGVREREVDGGEVELTTIAAAVPARGVLEAAASRTLDGWDEQDVPADWRERRARFGGGAFLVAGRLLVRSPWDPPAAAGVLDLVLERGGGGFGSGSHATTRMCLELLLGLEPHGGAADLGCGLGTLAIAAARLGWTPVLGVDRMAGAVEAARANGARNEAQVDWRVADLESDPVPLAPLLLVNAPPPVHARVAAALAAAEAVEAAGGDAAPAGDAAAEAVEAAVGDAAAESADAAVGDAAAESAEAAVGDAASASADPAAGDAASASAAAPTAAAAAAAAGGRVGPRHAIVSGVVPAELDSVSADYAAAGWAVVAARDEDGWAAALLEPRRA